MQCGFDTSPFHNGGAPSNGARRFRCRAADGSGYRAPCFYGVSWTPLRETLTVQCRYGARSPADFSSARLCLNLLKLPRILVPGSKSWTLERVMRFCGLRRPRSFRISEFWIFEVWLWVVGFRALCLMVQALQGHGTAPAFEAHTETHFFERGRTQKTHDEFSKGLGFSVTISRTTLRVAHASSTQ